MMPVYLKLTWAECAFCQLEIQFIGNILVKHLHTLGTYWFSGLILCR